MTPQEFIKIWHNVALTERSASQSHFINLCELVGVMPPVQADPHGTWFTFEKGTNKNNGTRGWADVWRKDHFAWEYKYNHNDLDDALDQLRNYAIALQQPPLLIVSDMHLIRIHTNWNNTVQKVYDIPLDQLGDAKNIEILKAAFNDPERLKPSETRKSVTEDAASKFSQIAERLHGRGFDPQDVAHFVNRLVFCLFAEDVGLLPSNVFSDMVKKSHRNLPIFPTLISELFSKMKTGGAYGSEIIPHFNGGLFDSDAALPLEFEDMDDLVRATALDWSEIDPSIFGTLFERGLDPDKRSQLGAHYTDQHKIEQVVLPAVIEPLKKEWSDIKTKIQSIMLNAPQAAVGTNEKKKISRALKKATNLHLEFITRLNNLRILDPACGSGNFLYVALIELKNLEHLVNLEAEELGLPRQFPSIGPEAMLGIELSPYAAELARVSVWIGEIQWMRRNGFSIPANPILKNLSTIQNCDALIDVNGNQTVWPKADVVVGNPPWLGNKKMISRLGATYTKQVRKAFPSTSNAIDLVGYWVVKCWELINTGNLERAGLVCTNSIRGGPNREIMDEISTSGSIFNAWSDEPWEQDGAAVRASIICFDLRTGVDAYLNGDKVPKIYSNLTANSTGVDVTKANKLADNRNCAFQGTIKTGPFDIPGKVARNLINLPANPNKKFNIDVIKPWLNGKDIAGRPSDTWVIDFNEMPLKEAAWYQEPYKLLKDEIAKTNAALASKGKKALREGEPNRKLTWHQLQRPRPQMRKALEPLTRYIATPRVSKHRIFVFVDKKVLPDTANVVIARDDYVIFGILQSVFHEKWSLACCTYLGAGNDPRYSHQATFETFPFPDYMTPSRPASSYLASPAAKNIERCARALDVARNEWLFPSSEIIVKPDVHPSLPELKLPKDQNAALMLKKRTMTALYNEYPDWLENAHADLNAAVAEAYGWGTDWHHAPFNDEEIVSRLFQLNKNRSP